MPLINSSLQVPAAVPGVQAGSLGLFAGFALHFPSFSAFTTAVTANRTDPLWQDGQRMTVADEADSQIYRVWRTALNNARTVVFAPGVSEVLAADSNVVMQALGKPSNGTGNNGDLSVDLAHRTVYLKTAGAWVVRRLLTDGRMSINNWLSSAQVADALARGAALNSTAELQQAMADCEANNWGLLIPRTHLLRADYVTGGTGNLHIVGGGTIRFSGTDGALEYAPPLGTARTVSAQSNTAFPTSGYANNLSTRLTLDPGGVGDFAAGDVAFIVCTAGYAFDSTVQRGEILPVAGVDVGNNYVYLAGLLGEDYIAAVTAAGGGTVAIRKMSRNRLIIDDGLTFVGDGTVGDSMVNVRSTLAITGAIAAKVDARFEHIPGRGLVSVGSFDGDFTVSAFDLKDDATNGFYGYPAVAMGATRDSTFRVDATLVRHAFTTNTYTRGVQGVSGSLVLWDTGMPRGNRVTGQAWNTTSASWDTHPGAFDTLFENIHSRWTHQNDDDSSGTGRQYGIQLRGCGDTVNGGSVIGGQHGIIVLAQETIYGRDNQSRINAVVFRNLSGSNSRIAVQTGIRNTDSGESSFKRRVTFTDCSWEGYQSLNTTAGGPDGVDFVNPIFINQAQMRLSANSTVSFIGGHRRSTSGAGEESIRVNSGATVNAYGFGLLGNAALASMFNGSGTSGQSGTLNHANCYCDRSATTLTSADAGFTLTANSMVRAS